MNLIEINANANVKSKNVKMDTFLIENFANVSVKSSSVSLIIDSMGISASVFAMKFSALKDLSLIRRFVIVFAL